MKTFQSKNLHDSRTVGLLKGLTLLFLGASVAVLATYGLTIDPSINNSVQYIQKIILTNDGTASGATGVVIDGNGTTKLIVNGQSQFNGTGTFSGKVGIGGINPIANLDVGGTMIVRRPAPNGEKLLDIDPNNIIVKIGDIDGLGDSVFLTIDAGNNKAYLPNGNFGIGTSTPSVKLDVNGTTKLSGDVNVNGNANINGNTNINGNILFSTGNRSIGVSFGNSDDLTISAGSADDGFGGGRVFIRGGGAFEFGQVILTTGGTDGGNVGIGTMNPVKKLTVVGDTKLSGNVEIRGNVGIGTSTPQAKLDVNGNTHFSGTIQVMPWRFQDVHYTDSGFGALPCQTICAYPIVGGPSTGSVCLAAYDLNASIMTGCVTATSTDISCLCVDHN